MVKGEGSEEKKKGMIAGCLNATGKLEKKNKETLQLDTPNAVISSLVPSSEPAHASIDAQATYASSVTSQERPKDNDELEELSGFIFMCNGRTKPDCYRYRVFGLPVGRKEIVEKIKPGMKLFLFDFEVKLLYGVYGATSTGKLNLEPAAFGGRFPAQVSFRIEKDCLPLPESSFKHAIQENYQKGKFSQELNGQQLRSILSLFRPFTMPPSASVPMSPAFPYTAMPQAVLEPGLAPATEDQFQPQARLPPPADQYVPGIQLHYIPSALEPQHASQSAVHPHYAYHGSVVNRSHAHLSTSLHNQPAPRLIHLEEPYVPRVPGSHDQSMLETEHVVQTLLPSHYDSYEAMVNTVQTHPVVEAQMPLASTTSNLSAEVQPAYLLGNASLSLLGPYQRYRAAGELVPSGQHFGFGTEYHQLPSSQRHPEVVLQRENAVQPYIPSLITENSHPLIHSQLYAQISGVAGQPGGNVVIAPLYAHHPLQPTADSLRQWGH